MSNSSPSPKLQEVDRRKQAFLRFVKKLDDVRHFIEDSLPELLAALLVAKKFDHSKKRKYPDRPAV